MWDSAYTKWHKWDATAINEKIKIKREVKQNEERKKNNTKQNDDRYFFRIKIPNNPPTANSRRKASLISVSTSDGNEGFGIEKQEELRVPAHTRIHTWLEDLCRSTEHGCPDETETNLCSLYFYSLPSLLSLTGCTCMQKKNQNTKKKQPLKPG